MQNDDKLKLLSIFYYLLGGITALFSLFPIIHIIMGIMIASGTFIPSTPQNPGPPPFMGWFFIIIGSIVILIGMTFAILLALTGRFISKRKHYIFCMVMAGVSCLGVPVGTVLGVFTILTLNKDDVKVMFEPQNT